MTPNDIEILIHCHVSPSQHPRQGSAAVKNSIEGLLCAGLIQRDEQESEKHEQAIYCSTKRGRAHIKQITQLPLPRAVWVDSAGEVID